jgi:hypothetical protein
MNEVNNNERMTIFEQKPLLQASINNSANHRRCAEDINNDKIIIHQGEVDIEIVSNQSVKSNRKASVKTKIIQNDLKFDEIVKRKGEKRKTKKMTNEVSFSNQKDSIRDIEEIALFTENKIDANAISMPDFEYQKRNNNPLSSMQRFKLVQQVDIYICKLPHYRTVISKILNIRLLRRWKLHKLILTDTEIVPTNVCCLPLEDLCFKF